MGTVDSAEATIERAERAMAGLPRDFYHQAIREADRRPSPKLPNGRCNGIGILYRQVLVIQEHLNGHRNSLRGTIVDGGEYPRGFGERQVRHPRSLRDERLGGSNLLRIISRDEPDEYVGVNGPHGVY